MSKSAGFAFQGGPFVEVFTPQGKDPTANWKVTGSVRKIFEKEVKSYIYVLEGVPTTTKIQLPKDSKSTVTLVQRFLVLQIYLAKGQDFNFELGLTDLGKNKRRVLFSTSQRDIQTTPLHAKIPLSIVKRGIWLNLCFDLTSVVSDTWKGQTFRSVENLTISANCKLRRVFTMKVSPQDTTEDDVPYESNTFEVDMIPRQCQLATDIQQLTQVFTVGKLKALERQKAGGESSSRLGSVLELDLNASGRRSVLTETNSYRRAFGSKVPASIQRKSGKDNLSSSRSSRSNTSRVDESLSMKNSFAGHESVFDVRDSTASERISAVPLTAERAKSELPFSQPHPPREPSKDRQRRRIRVKGQGTDSQANGMIKDGGKRREASSSSSSISRPVSNTVTSGEEEANSSNNSKFSSDGDLDDTVSREPATEDKGLQTPRYRERRLNADTRDSGVGPFVPEIQSPRKDVTDTEPLDDSMSDVIRVLKQQVEAMTSDDSETDDNSGVGEYVESDEAEENGVYMFVSPPKSAPRRNISPSQEDSFNSQTRKTSTKSSSIRNLSSNLSLRGARLEADFMDSQSSEEEEDGQTRTKPSSRSQSGKSSAGRNRQHESGVGSKLGDGPHTQAITMSRSPGAIPHLALPGEYSPDNYRVPGEGTATGSPRLNGSVGTSSMSRMSRKSLREIPRTDARLSLAKTSESSKAYDHTKYQVIEDLSESYEANMLASLKRQQDEETDTMDVGGSRPLLNHSPRGIIQGLGQVSVHHPMMHIEESPTTTSDDDTSLSTWKAPAPGQLVHNYQEEMRYPHSRLSSDTLTSSNPRDWSGVFSPPILLPGDPGTINSSTSDSDHLSKTSPRKPVKDASPRESQIADGSKTTHLGMSVINNDVAQASISVQEEELDLLYDPCLNCYFDPHTCKYYELI
ncbi:protein CFAP20DC-like isoform X2 [Liolophura sinensis]|uniref:protein CFAP20DC-like isoform X2 n=1 Tax=Liolophura sinensis TaxID=3198878 RepID=UPI003158F8CF